MRVRSDRRSPEAKAWRALYNTAVWKRLRRAQLTDQPLCERCEKAGRVTAATVVNHRKPHKGDWSLFADPDNLESACEPHQNADIQQEEAKGFSLDVGADGFPTDPRHPFNA